jgi:predicted RNA-binding protein associated with RNAse of E/G family
MVHKPKVESTQRGCALASATRNQAKLPDGSIVLTEVWNEMLEDWEEGNTIIARPGYKWVSKWQVGKPYVIVKFYDSEEALIGIYCDVCHPATRNQQLRAPARSMLDIRVSGHNAH